MVLLRLLINIILVLCISIVSGEKNEERVVLVAPVLAANKNPRARVIETAKDFPILKLLSIDNVPKVNILRKPAVEPIYVENHNINYHSAVKTHEHQKRDVYGLDTYAQTYRTQAKDQTIIIVPNGGTNLPYQNPISRYGIESGNKGPTVVINNSPDKYYSNGYGRTYTGI